MPLLQGQYAAWFDSTHVAEYREVIKAEVETRDNGLWTRLAIAGCTGERFFLNLNPDAFPNGWSIDIESSNTDIVRSCKSLDRPKAGEPWVLHPREWKFGEVETVLIDIDIRGGDLDGGVTFDKWRLIVDIFDMDVEEFVRINQQYRLRDVKVDATQDVAFVEGALEHLDFLGHSRPIQSYGEVWKENKDDVEFAIIGMRMLGLEVVNAPPPIEEDVSEEDELADDSSEIDELKEDDEDEGKVRSDVTPAEEAELQESHAAEAAVKAKTAVGETTSSPTEASSSPPVRIPMRSTARYKAVKAPAKVKIRDERRRRARDEWTVDYEDAFIAWQSPRRSRRLFLLDPVRSKGVLQEQIRSSLRKVDRSLLEEPEPITKKMWRAWLDGYSWCPWDPLQIGRVTPLKTKRAIEKAAEERKAEREMAASRDEKEDEWVAAEIRRRALPEESGSTSSDSDDDDRPLRPTGPPRKRNFLKQPAKEMPSDFEIRYGVERRKDLCSPWDVFIPLLEKRQASLDKEKARADKRAGKVGESRAEGKVKSGDGMARREAGTVTLLN